MDIKPIWADYATYDEEGYINGVVDDAPEEVKKAFADHQADMKRREESTEPIFKY